MMSSGHDALNFNEQSNILTHSNVLSSYRWNEYLWPCCLDCVITRSSSDKMSQSLLFRDKLINTSLSPFPHAQQHNAIISPIFSVTKRTQKRGSHDETKMGKLWEMVSVRLLVHVDDNSINTNHSICHYIFIFWPNVKWKKKVYFIESVSVSL